MNEDEHQDDGQRTGLDAAPVVPRNVPLQGPPSDSFDQAGFPVVGFVQSFAQRARGIDVDRVDVEKYEGEEGEDSVDEIGTLPEDAKTALKRRGSETLKRDPKAKLDHYREIDGYFSRQEKGYMKEVERFSKEAGEMDPNCELSVCIPVAGHQEGANIYRTLEGFKNQTAPKEKFEVVLMVNHPDVDPSGRAVKPDQTMNEIARFQKDNPDMRIRVIYKVFPLAEAKIGTIRKLANDVAMYRHHARGEGAKDLILVSNDADMKGVSPEYVGSMLKDFAAKPNVDAIRGELDWDLEAYANNPMVHIGTRLFQYLGIYGRSRSGGMTSSGANFAYRSSIYSAVGGHARMGGGEDVLIGQMIVSARGTKDALAHGASSSTRNFSSARRSEAAVAKGVSPVEQWVAGFGAFDSVRTYELKPGEKINYEDPTVVAKFKVDLENVLNRTVDVYESGDRLGKGSKMYRKCIGLLGIEYKVEKLGGKEKVVVTNMDRLVNGLKVYQVEGPLIQKAKSGDAAAAKELKDLREKRRKDTERRRNRRLDRALGAFNYAHSQPVFRSTVPRYTLADLQASHEKIHVNEDYVMCKDRFLGASTRSVYYGYNSRTNELVAMKILSAEERAFVARANKYPSGVQNIFDYAQKKGISDPHLDVPLLVTDPVDGQLIQVHTLASTDLEKVVERHGPLNTKKALEVVIRIASTIRDLNDEGVLHADISPHNVLVGFNGDVIVGDLDDVSISNEGSFVRGFEGMNRHVSPPELGREGVTLDTSVDTYELCCTFYFLLTGQSPYFSQVADIEASQRNLKLAQLHTTGNFEMPSGVAPSVRKILKKGINPIISSRYRNMADMLEDLLKAYNNLSS